VLDVIVPKSHANLQVIKRAVGSFAVAQTTFQRVRATSILKLSYFHRRLKIKVKKGPINA